MDKKIKKALWEGLKEPLRIFVCAVIPVIIALLAELDYGWILVGTAILRALDRFLHQLAPKGKAGGIGF